MEEPKFDMAVAPMGGIASPAFHEEKMPSDEKKGFIKKVYGIVTFQLVITFAMVYLSSYSASFGAFCAHPVTLCMACLLMICCMVGAMCVASRVPYNYIMLIMFTLSMGAMVSACTAAIAPSTVALAIFVTLVMSFAITVFTWTVGEGAAVMAIIGLVFATFLLEFFAIALIFTPHDWLLSCYCSLVALSYGCYLIIDTYIVQESQGVDDYIVAAIVIYVDIIRIFIYVLAALSSKK